MINTIISEIFEIVLPFILGFTYYYLTILLLIFIISPIIILIATLSINMPNKTKLSILIPNTICLFIIIHYLLPFIYSSIYLLLLYYEIILNNIYMYMPGLFSIFSLILAEIYRNIELFVIIYVITIIISTIMILFYGFREICPIETLNFEKYKEYIINKNKKFFIVASVLSIISGLMYLFLILKTYSSYFIGAFFLLILLIASILSYMLSYNQENKKDKANPLSEEHIGTISSWSSLLGLNFFEIKKSIAYIFEFYSLPYILITYSIVVAAIFFLMFIMALYVYIVNTNRNLENMVKWTISAGFSISLLTVYLFGYRSIWYIIIGFLSFFILMYLFCRIHLHILKNINKKNWSNILSRILAVYAFSTYIIYFIENASVLFIAIGYIILFIVYPYIVMKHNKNDDHNRNNLIPEK